MRYPLFTTTALGIALLAAPAAHAKADEVPATQTSEEKLIQVADKFADKDLQNNIASLVERMTGVMMGLPVGKFVSAIEEAKPGSVKKSIPEDATFADLAGEDADAIPETMGKQSRVAMSMMSGFAKAFASILPEFEAAAEEMEEALKK